MTEKFDEICNLLNSELGERLGPVLIAIGIPIGNYLDISLRAIQTLNQCDLILVEDTRKAGIFLSKLGIKKKLVAYHDHNEVYLAEKLVEQIQSEELVAGIISDAGTPCISDPGFRLFKAAHAKGLTCSAIPGPSATITLLSASGLACNRFSFIGFLPTKKSKRQNEIKSWKEYCSGSLIFFETAIRLQASLESIQEFYPNLKVVIGRELTKKFEEFLHFSVLNDAIEWSKSASSVLKGEFVIAVELDFESEEVSPVELENKIQALLDEGLKTKEIVKKLKVEGIQDKNLYDYVLKVKNSQK